MVVRGYIRPGTSEVEIGEWKLEFRDFLSMHPSTSPDISGLGSGKNSSLLQIHKDKFYRWNQVLGRWLPLRYLKELVLS